MNLPGIGNVELLTSIKNLPEQIIHTRDKNENRGFYQHITFVKLSLSVRLIV